MLASALDGGVVRLVSGFLDRDTLCGQLIQTSRVCFSAASCHSQACRTHLYGWRTSAIATLFEQDKRLSRAVSWVECIILVRHSNAMLEEEEDGLAAERFEGMALRSQMVAALERAVAAAAHHAEECAEVNAKLLAQTGRLSRFLSWLKLQRHLYQQELAGTPEQQARASMRLECTRQEAVEFRQRLSMLLRAAETFVALVAGCGGAVERHQRLVKVVRMAQLARPDGLGSDMEEECERIHEAWTHAARRLDAVVYSLHMRCEAFGQLAYEWGWQEASAASSLECSGTHAGKPGAAFRASASERSVSKLSILNAIASSTTSGSNGEASQDASGRSGKRF